MCVRGRAFLHSSRLHDARTASDARWQQQWRVRRDRAIDPGMPDGLPAVAVAAASDGVAASTAAVAAQRLQ